MLPLWVRRHGWLVLCSTVLIMAVMGIIGYIFWDILDQSFSTGQFWNSIIALGYLGASGLFSLLTFFLRLARDRMWLHQLPRDHTVSARDTPRRVWRVIQNKFSECCDKFDEQVPRVDHPGLQNPKTEAPLETPYFSIIEGMPVLLEESFLSFYGRFKRKSNMTLRSYLEWALESQILDGGIAAHVDAFVGLYERARYGGLDLSEPEFYTLFTGCITIVRSIKVPQQAKVDQEDSWSDAGSVIVRRNSSIAGDDPLQQYIISRRGTRTDGEAGTVSEGASMSHGSALGSALESALGAEGGSVVRLGSSEGGSVVRLGSPLNFQDGFDTLSPSGSPALSRAGSVGSLSSLSRWNTRASLNSTHTVLHHH